MSITKSVPLKSYFFNEIFFRKIGIFFDIENWLWMSEFCHFWQLMLNWAQDFLGGWLLVLSIKEGLVECATVCLKSVVILEITFNFNGHFDLHQEKPGDLRQWYPNLPIGWCDPLESKWSFSTTRSCIAKFSFLNIIKYSN